MRLRRTLPQRAAVSLAATLLASAAIRALFAMLPIANREQALAGISAFIDGTLNMSGPAKGDAHDEFNTQMRETARFQAMQSLDAIERLFRKPPIHIPFLRDAANLSRMRSPITSRSN